MNDPFPAIKPPTKSRRVPTWRAGLVAVGITSFFLNILLLTGPFYMLQIYDRVLSSQSLPTLAALSLLVGALFVLYGLLDFTRSRLMVRVSSLFDLGLAERSFDASVSCRASHEQVQDPVKDLRCVQQFLMSPAATNIFDVPWFPIYLLAIYLLHPALAALALGGAVVLIVLAAINASISRNPERTTLKYAAEEDQLVGACKQNIDSVHSMGMLPAVARQWRTCHRNLLIATRSSSDRNTPLAATSRTVRLLVQSAILGFGAYLVIGTSLSAGSLIAASIMFGRALAPMDSAIANWRNVVTAINSWSRLKKSLKSGDAKSGAVKLKKPKTSLSVVDLTLSVPGQQKPIVNNASFELRAGDALAIIGPSGGGKSSLLRGVLGVLPCSSGSARLDGATLDQWDHQQRGEVVGYLPQNVQLFDGTIAENICRFNDPIDSDAVLRAAELCGVHSLITQLHDGYNTRVGPLGHQLSAGQVQRIGLARAVFDMPFLVVLDEPNAHLDAEGEMLLNKTIAALRANGSIVMVAAHRKSALAATNKALLIVDGEVKMCGDRDRVLNHLPKKQPATNGGLRVVGS
jgi:ATP-binding cassette, subfamily C, type I secretion system permease/ATPase